ncbi:MAG TPA: hypothetical protein VFW23_08065 [Tepidisphaeraceae bacterium]|nr:hypothetical protein [Tepidisphaeraceae bacterium]
MLRNFVEQQLQRGAKFGVCCSDWDMVGKIGAVTKSRARSGAVVPP